MLLTWLGQAGFLFRGSSGRVLMVDPYLSDHARSSHGIPRVMEAPIAAASLVPDVLLITHPDVDHLDPPTVEEYASVTGPTLVAAPSTARIAREQHGWAGPCVDLAADAAAEVAGARVTATWTRHGTCEEVRGPEVEVGFVLELDGLALWHLGDTEYDAQLHRLRARDVDVLFLPINGTGGNMNAHEAALLAAQLKPGLAVPMHFGMWAWEHYAYRGGEPWATPDPELFRATYGRLSPDAATWTPVLGEVLALRRGASGRGVELSVLEVGA